MTEFGFRMTKEQIDRFRNLTAKEKLEWLQEINEFVNTFVPAQKRKRWEEYKNRIQAQITQPRSL